MTDYFAPPKIVIGEREPGITGRLLGIYDGIDGTGVRGAAWPWPRWASSSTTAGTRSRSPSPTRSGAWRWRAASIRRPWPRSFLADTKLNVSADYLRPGGPYGGSCLPKDLAGMLALAREAGLDLPVIAGARTSNGLHLAWLAEAIRTRSRRPARSCSWACRSRPAPTICATARCWHWPSGWSRPATTWRSTTPTSIRPGWSASTSRSRPSTGRPLLDRLTGDLEGAAGRARLIVLGKPLPGVRERLPPGVPVFDLARLEGIG